MKGFEGKILTAVFELDGQKLMALDGGPTFKFNEAFSLLVECDNQEEIDMYWEKLTEGGQEGPCGWLKDKYGLSWQIVPQCLVEMLKNGTPEQRKRVTEVFMPMKKMIIADLEKAYNS